MKIRILTVVMLLNFFAIGFGASNLIYMENGVSWSSTNGFVLDKSATSYQGLVGWRFFKKSILDLSAEAGYRANGGAAGIEINDDNGVLMEESNVDFLFDYITADMMIGVSDRIGNFEFNAGVGPRLDFGVNTKSDIMKTRTVMYGLKCNVGVAYCLNRLQIGVRAGYLPNFNGLYYDVIDKKYARSSSLTFGITVGWQL